MFLSRYCVPVRYCVPAVTVVLVAQAVVLSRCCVPAVTVVLVALGCGTV